VRSCLRRLAINVYHCLPSILYLFSFHMSLLSRESGAHSTLLCRIHVRMNDRPLLMALPSYDGCDLITRFFCTSLFFLFWTDDMLQQFTEVLPKLASLLPMKSTDSSPLTASSFSAPALPFPHSSFSPVRKSSYLFLFPPTSGSQIGFLELNLCVLSRF